MFLITRVQVASTSNVPQRDIPSPQARADLRGTPTQRFQAPSQFIHRAHCHVIVLPSVPQQILLLQSNLEPWWGWFELGCDSPCCGVFDFCAELIFYFWFTLCYTNYNEPSHPEFYVMNLSKQGLTQDVENYCALLCIELEVRQVVPRAVKCRNGS